MGFPVISNLLLVSNCFSPRLTLSFPSSTAAIRPSLSLSHSLSPPLKQFFSAEAYRLSFSICQNLLAMIKMLDVEMNVNITAD